MPAPPCTLSQMRRLERIGVRGPSPTLTLSRDLCDPATPVAIDVSLVAHSGKTRQFKQELATHGLQPAP